jgi:hypothetical protein
MLVACLGAVGGAWADEVPAATAERGPAAATPRDAQGRVQTPSPPAEDCSSTKPYGSGYEARCLDTGRGRVAAASPSASGAASAVARDAGALNPRAVPDRFGRGAAAGGIRGGAGHGRRR